MSLEPPPAFQAATLAQILRADKQVWTYLAQNCQDIRPTAAGIKPFDAMFDDALRDYNTSFHLLPLPKETFVANTRYKQESNERPSFQSASGKGKGKGKSKGKGSGASSAPRGMVGCVGRTPKAVPFALISI